MAPHAGCFRSLYLPPKLLNGGNSRPVLLVSRIPSLAYCQITLRCPLIEGSSLDSPDVTIFRLTSHEVYPTSVEAHTNVPTLRERTESRAVLRRRFTAK